MPAMVAKVDGSLFFNVVAVIFAIGAVTALVFFPASGAVQQSADAPAKPKLGLPVWFGLFGLVSMALVYSMTMSFVERVGVHREYGLVLVSTVLTVMAVTKLFPAALAGLLENRVQVKHVLIGAPIVQALACTAIFAVPNVTVYAVAAPIFITTLLFAQVFAFGVISRLEPTGRATALSPSIMMVGSGVGPFLGGSLIKAFGYPSLAGAGCLVALCAIGFFSRLLVHRATAAKTVSSEPA
jgi:predicted MFS family arabinose efflux permease